MRPVLVILAGFALVTLLLGWTRWLSNRHWAAAGNVLIAVLLLAPRHLQHTGQVHAGVVVSMADHTMGIAAQTLAAEGFMVITAEVSTSLLRAAGGERLVCEARVVKPGRSISFTEADVYCESADQPRVATMCTSLPS